MELKVTIQPPNVKPPKMTREQRADVWKRRLAIGSELSLSKDPDEIERLKKAFQSCDKELIDDIYNPPPKEEQPSNNG